MLQIKLCKFYARWCFPLSLPKKRGSRVEKRPLRSAAGHETERGLEFSAKGGGGR